MILGIDTNVRGSRGSHGPLTHGPPVVGPPFRTATDLLQACDRNIPQYRLHEPANIHEANVKRVERLMGYDNTSLAQQLTDAMRADDRRDRWQIALGVASVSTCICITIYFLLFQ